MLDFDRLAFVGAVGSLVPEIPLGTLCTPAWSVSGNLANGYLLEDLSAYQPFERVWPNDPGFVALLAVSDNSATGDPLLARTETQKTAYNHCRRQVIPKLLFEIARM